MLTHAHHLSLSHCCYPRFVVLKFSALEASPSITTRSTVSGTPRPNCFAICKISPGASLPLSDITSASSSSLATPIRSAIFSKNVTLIRLPSVNHPPDSFGNPRFPFSLPHFSRRNQVKRKKFSTLIPQ
jgi:hypothetical protein